MTIADRILALRKAKGISQEELADRIGVSRQAVSKWESEQSSPDMEKVILLSDYFEVTTDYLLKGIEPKTDRQERKSSDARMWSAAGTAINFIGLVTAIMLWMERQTADSVGVGIIFFIVGCEFFVLGQITGENKAPARKWFFVINVWILLLMPVTCVFNFASGILGGHWWTFSPVPQLKLLGSFELVGLCWVCYIGCCVLADVFVVWQQKKVGSKRQHVNPSP